jgi:hypothetical protein
MIKPALYKLSVLFSTLAWAGCGSDPYAGVSAPLGAGGSMGGGGGAATATGGATTATSGGPDAGTDTPVGVPLINYNITVAPTRQLDLVFMIDNSPSMAPKVAKMNAQFPKLIAALRDPTDGTLPDLRVAIIDSDLGTGGAYSSGSCGPKTLPDGTMSSYGDLGRFQMINATSCGVNTSDATYFEYKAGQAVNYKGDINMVFACLASNLGTLGCGEEHSLQAFEFALLVGGLGAVNDAQHSMLRATANLGLVFLTDEDDCSAAPNDGMFGNKPELYGESASLRCYSRSHVCNGISLTNSSPGYPTTSAFSAPLSQCAARTDACDVNGVDSSNPTSCSPLRDIKTMAEEIRALKGDPANQIFLAGIFGWPLSAADMATATYKIAPIPNPNTADTAHPTVFDSWPVCYDPNHLPTNRNVFDPTAARWGATAGLRAAAFIDEFGANGQKFSICQPDFSAAMSVIGTSLAKKLQTLCIDDKLLDQDTATPGLQPACRAVYRTPVPDPSDPSKVTYYQSATSLPTCPAGATSGKVSEDCWQLVNDAANCPVRGQLVNVLRTAANLAAGPLPAGTVLGMECWICSTSPSAVPVEGCNY